jgi:hypothetical protein
VLKENTWFCVIWGSGSAHDWYLRNIRTKNGAKSSAGIVKLSQTPVTVSIARQATWPVSTVLFIYFHCCLSSVTIS